MTSRSLLPALALLLVATLFAWWQLAPSTPTPGLPSGEAPPGALATAGPGERKPTEPPAADRVAADAAVVTSRVRVDVTLPNGDPAVGAIVRAGELEAVTDARGAVELSLAEGPTITATLGTLYGEGEWLEGWTGDVGRVCVELAPDVHLVVEVLDPTGVPQQGVNVGVEAKVATRRGGLHDPAWVVTTDARGRAELDHLQCRAGYVDGLAATVHVYAYARTVYVARSHLAERTFEWNALAADPIVRLVVPASGTIEVRLVDADGKPLPFDSRIENADGWRLAADTEGDAEVFRQVPLGRTWSLWVDGGVVRSLRGPERPNEIVRAEVPWNVHAWRFRGRVVRSGGMTSSGDERVWLSLRDPREPDVELARDNPRRDEPFELLACITSATLPDLEVRVEPPEHTLAAGQTFTLGRALRAGDIDLGDIVLAPPPDVVELASCEVHLEGRVVTHEVQYRLSLRDGTRDEEQPFLTRRRGDAVQVFGRAPTGPLWLDCWTDDSLTLTPIELRRGEHHRIELRRAASLRIDLAHHRVPDEALVAELLPLHVADAAPERAAVQAHTLTWHGLTPGAYALTIRCGGQVLANERELVLAPGPQHWPPDGRAVDVRGATSVHVLVRSGLPNGGLLRAGVALARADTPADTELDWQEGWFVPDASQSDLLVRSRGHVPVRLARPAADMEVVLLPLTDLWVRAADGDDDRWHVRIVSDGVVDPLLRAVDRDHEHRVSFHCASNDSLEFAPGTVLEFTRVTDGAPPPAQRVEVGSSSPQCVELR